MTPTLGANITSRLEVMASGEMIQSVNVQPASCIWCVTLAMSGLAAVLLAVEDADAKCRRLLAADDQSSPSILSEVIWTTLI